ncbi:hypothetical protein C2S52_019045 [Perilla frutescens var. hirtella]|nr:hypothetical protein C2S52_019045 [Perilla frutescens var. hirtella]
MRRMKFDPWTREFDGFEKPRGWCRIAAVGIRTRATRALSPAVAGNSQQDSKRKTFYEPWTKEHIDVLLELMVDAAHRGWRDNSGIFSKITVEERILSMLNERLRCNKTYSNYQSRLKWFKNRWTSYSNLLRVNSDFLYDHITKKFTASDEVCDAYLEAHSKDANLCYGKCPDYEDLLIVVGNGVAVGKNSIRLGSATDANTLGNVENRDACIEDLTFDSENEAFVALSQDELPSSGSTPPYGLPEVPEGSTQRRNLPKRSRTQYEATSGSTDNIMEEIKNYPTLRRPISRTGYHFVKNMIEGDPQSFQQLYRMYSDAFMKLCSIIREKTHLEDTRYICVEEMVAIFLIIVGHNDRYCNVYQRFHRSHFATSQNFNKILQILNTIASDMMVKTSTGIPAKIKESTRFMPFLKDCIGAIDGTHISAMVTGREVSSFRNRHGMQSQNVLGACNFDLQFIYVLSGWECSAHDSKLLSGALSRTNGLQVPQGKYFLVDCAFAKFL